LWSSSFYWEGIVNSLGQLFKSPDATVRQISTECILIYSGLPFHLSLALINAGHAAGRLAILSHALIVPLSQLVSLFMFSHDDLHQFDDNVDAVRMNTHSTLSRVTASEDGVS
jgi:hypothetical protein